VHLVDAPAGDQVIRPTGPHVCFGVEDLDGAIAELERDGIPLVRGAQGEVVQIWVTDPAGNTIELQQDPEVRTPSA
jgi:catechol 2,3-dioxygenase-like lactoylglutathione lyase family enzyme